MNNLVLMLIVMSNNTKYCRQWLVFDYQWLALSVSIRVCVMTYSQGIVESGVPQGIILGPLQFC